MSMPKIPDINPDISLDRTDAINLMITSIAMAELSLAHILNAEGEKLQYVLGTLQDRDPGEVTICDIMEVNKSVERTIRDTIKAEILLHFKLEDAIELDNSKESTGCRQDIEGCINWEDNDNLYGTRPDTVRVNLLRDGVVYKSVEVDSFGDGGFTFMDLPIWKDSSQKYVYTVDLQADPSGYTKSTQGFIITNTLGEITISGTKTWDDNNDSSGERPATITVLLTQNGGPFRSTEVTSPPSEETTAPYTFSNVPVFDADGTPYTYAVDEDDVPGYTRVVTGFDITNTHP